MKFSLGTTIPTVAPVNQDPAVDPSNPVLATGGAAAPPCPSPPPGYWVNPANCTQWLPPAQGAQVGNVCWFGTGIMPGRLRVGGNEANTQLYCGSFFNSPATDSLVFYGGAAALAFFFLPAPYKWWVAVPLAGLAVLGATLGGITI